MSVNMSLVRVDGNNEGMSTFRPAKSQLIPDFQRLLWLNLTGQETLPNAVGNYISLALVTPGSVLVLLLRKHKFLYYRSRIALITFNQLTSMSFSRIL